MAREYKDNPLLTDPGAITDLPGHRNGPTSPLRRPRSFLRQANPSGMFSGGPGSMPVRIRLNPPHSRVFRSAARFRSLVAGRRFGKTVLCLVEILAHGLQTQDGLIAYIAPNRQQAKRIAWKKLKFLAAPYLARKPQETELTLELVTGTTVMLLGAENYDAIRGLGLTFAVFDEFADVPAAAWTDVVRPALADNEGRCLFIGTPKGYNHFYDVHQSFLEGSEPDGEAFSFTTLQGGYVSPEEVEASRRSLSLRQFRQEFEASFENVAGRVYHCFQRRFNVVELDERSRDFQYLVGLDFNVNPMTAVVAVRHHHGVCYVVNEVELHSSNTPARCNELKRLYAGKNILAYPDPSCRQRRTNAPAGQTDFNLLIQAGFKVVAPARTPPIVDRVNCVNAMLENGNGDRRLFIHPRCKRLIKALEGLTYADGTNLPEKKTGLDHVADALGYLIYSEFPIFQRGVGVQKLIGA
jgi:hypothetical protein